MDEAERVQKCFQVAQEVTIEALITKKGLSRDDAVCVINEDIEQIRTAREQIKTLDDIYRRLITSIQNRGMMPNVIGDVRLLQDVLCDFSPLRVREKYDHDTRRLLGDMIKIAAEAGRRVRSGKKSMWRLFAAGCLSAAHYLEKFASPEDFYAYVDKWCQDPDIVSAFPLFLSQRGIEGLGPALAADFLKEVGVTALAKPDTHTRRALGIAGLIPSQKVSDLEVIRAFHRASQTMGTADYPPAVLDKILWQLGSGKFSRYNEPGRTNWKNALPGRETRFRQFRQRLSNS